MVDGLYKVDFANQFGKGSGVVVLQDGRLRGGDSASFYDGQYVIRGNELSASMEVDLHTANRNALHGVQRVHLDISAVINGNRIRGKGIVPNAPNLDISAVRLRD